jgi:hypothetical protein
MPSTGWSKAAELVKVARRDGKALDSATLLQSAVRYVGWGDPSAYIQPK